MLLLLYGDGDGDFLHMTASHVHTSSLDLFANAQTNHMLRIHVQEASSPLHTHLTALASKQVNVKVSARASNSPRSASFACSLVANSTKTHLLHHQSLSWLLQPYSPRSVSVAAAAGKAKAQLPITCSCTPYVKSPSFRHSSCTCNRAASTRRRPHRRGLAARAVTVHVHLP